MKRGELFDYLTEKSDPQWEGNQVGTHRKRLKDN